MNLYIYLKLTIGKLAFGGVKVTDRKFVSTKLKNFIIPKSVKELTIGYHAFYCNSFKILEIEDGCSELSGKISKDIFGVDSYISFKIPESLKSFDIFEELVFNHKKIIRWSKSSKKFIEYFNNNLSDKDFYDDSDSDSDESSDDDSLNEDNDYDHSSEYDYSSESREIEIQNYDDSDQSE